MLNFLNPSVLFALAAAAIPLLIHLLNRRKSKTIHFSTIHFLKKLEKKQMRNLRIRQLLLLILRTLIILLLVLAFARPTLRSGAGNLLAERTPIEAFIILDNSLSLNEVQMGGSLLRELRDVFNGLESVFQNGDRLTIVNGTFPVQKLIKSENYQANIWERVNQKLQPNYLKTNLSKALLMAVDELKQSPFSAREIYVVSDFQKSGMDLTRLESVAREISVNNIKLYAIPIAHKNFENISVDSVEIVNRLIEKNQPLRLKAFLSNHHPQKFLNTMASVLLNGNRVAQQNVDVKPGKISEVDFQLTLTENGFVEGIIEIESDAILEDNKRYFNFYVPQKIKILHFVPDADFISYLPLIIRPAQNRGIFQPHSEILLNWTNFNFKDYDILILEGLREIPSNLIKRLETFVEQGGGLMLIPGENIVIPSYGRIYKDFGLGSIQELRGSIVSREQFLTLDKFQWNHAIFEGLFSKQRKKLNPIEVYSAYRVRPLNPQSVIIGLSDGSPFLQLTSLGKGTCVSFSAALKPNWNQLPIKGFVVPLLYRLIYYSGTRKIIDRQMIRCGETYQQMFSNLEAPFNFQLRAAGEDEKKLTPRFKGPGVFLQAKELLIPGNYRIMQNGNPLVLFSVNPWKQESEMNFYSEGEITERFPHTVFLSDYEQIAANILKSRFGKELWLHFLTLAFILLFVEMLVARTGSKKEFSQLKVQEPAVKV